MRVLKPDDVYALDINARYLGIDTRLLMENAGKSVADVIRRRFPDKKRIVVIAGLGNNGGDGFVAARHLASYGYEVIVILLGRVAYIKSTIARENAEVLKRMRLSIKLFEAKDSTELTNIKQYLEEADIIIDAILGVGLRGSVKGLFAETINLINSVKQRKGVHVISIDVPSGLDCYSGRVQGPVIKPDITVTFHGIKKGLSEEVGGEIIVTNIGIPPEAEEFVGPGDVLRIKKLIRREDWAHKGDFGRILVIGGSEDFSGAPALAGLAALRAGADVVVIAAPSSVADIIRGFSPNLIVKKLKGSFLNHENVRILKDPEFISRFDTILIGPGIGVKEEVLSISNELIRYFSENKRSLVIDADALKGLSIKNIPKTGNIILTPHDGEFYKIFKIKCPKTLKERGEIVKKKAKETATTIVLKGHIDVISDGEQVKYNTTGNPGMTVGGTGDVLAGIIAAFYAISENAFNAAIAGAFISGLAGDFAYKEKGYELLATDVIEKIPEAISYTRRFLES
ncbi:MAG: NAD(P)H-hydrate dehydratase [Candidatus Njordarchaeales archaeon]